MIFFIVSDDEDTAQNLVLKANLCQICGAGFDKQRNLRYETCEGTDLNCFIARNFKVRAAALYLNL